MCWFRCFLPHQVYLLFSARYSLSTILRALILFAFDPDRDNEQRRYEARCGPVWSFPGGGRVRTALRAAADVFRELWEGAKFVTL